MSYGFPIINFCNPGVHYETPCILTINYAVGMNVELVRVGKEDVTAGKFL
jgi:hypothetical protein